MIVDKLKQSILNYAISGKLSTQMETDSSVDNMIDKIKIIRNKYIKNKIATDDKYQEISNDMIFNIPSSWRWIRLGEIGNWGSGSTPERGNQTFYKNGTVSWIKTGELNDGYIGESEEKITELALKKCSFKINNPGDILIAMYGATIGKLGIATITTTTNQACCGCSIYGGVVNKYLFYYLLSIRSKLIALGEGSGQPNISRKKIVNLPFPLPPIEEQQRIVDKIEELFEKLDEIKPIEDELEKIKSKFSDSIKKSILNEIIGKYKNNSINLGRISNINGGYAFKSAEYTKEGIRVIRISDFDEKGIKEENQVRYEYSTALEPYKLYNGNIIMCMTGGTVGKNILLKKIPNNYYTNQRVATIKVKDTFLPEYIYYCINTPYIQKKIQNNKNSTNDNISMALIKSFPIPNIPLNEQQKVISKIEQLLPLCDDITNIVEELNND